MDSDVLTRILRTVSRTVVSRISVALESQISEYLQLELGNAINNVKRLLANTMLFILNSFTFSEGSDVQESKLGVILKRLFYRIVDLPAIKCLI